MCDTIAGIGINLGLSATTLLGTLSVSLEASQSFVIRPVVDGVGSGGGVIMEDENYNLDLGVFMPAKPMGGSLSTPKGLSSGKPLGSPDLGSRRASKVGRFRLIRVGLGSLLRSVLGCILWALCRATFRLWLTASTVYVRLSIGWIDPTVSELIHYLESGWLRQQERVDLEDYLLPEMVPDAPPVAGTRTTSKK